MTEKSTTHFKNLGEKITVGFFDSLTGEIPDPEYTEAFLVGGKMTGWTTATIRFGGKDFPIDVFDSTNIWEEENGEIVFSIPILSAENSPNEKLAVAVLAAAPINPRT